MQVVFNLNILTCIVNQNIWFIFAMTLNVISRPFNIELLRLFLLDMVPLMQVLLKTDLCICRLQKKVDRIFFCHLKVISRPLKLSLLMLPVLVSLSVTALK